MGIACLLWQNNFVTSDAFLQILSAEAKTLDSNRLPSAIFALRHGDHLKHQQALADMANLALIRPLEPMTDQATDGYWTSDPRQLKTIQGQNRNRQLVGLAQDRHSAMTLGEAGADLILFGQLEPILVAGDLELARWWAQLFDLPCGVILTARPSSPSNFGGEGQPEFYACP